MGDDFPVGPHSGGARPGAAMRSMGSVGSTGDDFSRGPHSSDVVQRRAMEDAGAKALATLEAMGPLARNAMRVYLGLGMGVGEGERGHGRRAQLLRSSTGAARLGTGPGQHVGTTGT